MLSHALGTYYRRPSVPPRLRGESSSLPRRRRLDARRREPAAQRVLRRHPRPHELLEVVRPPRLRPHARELVAAERLAVHQRAGDLAVDVQVADAELATHALDV